VPEDHVVFPGRFQLLQAKCGEIALEKLKQRWGRKLLISLALFFHISNLFVFLVMRIHFP
jgi:hypothetical protein